MRKRERRKLELKRRREDVDNDTSLVTVISYDKIKNFKPDLSDSFSVHNVKH